MSDFVVSMRLQALDEASPALLKMAEVLNAVKQAASGVGSNLTKMAEGLTAVGAASGTATQVGTFARELGAVSLALRDTKAASSGVGADLSSIGNRAGGAGIGVSRLEQSLVALSPALRGVNAAAGTAGGAVQQIGQHAQNATGHVNQLGNALQRLNNAGGAGGGAGGAGGAGAGGFGGMFGQMTEFVKGMGLLYGAMKLGEGVRKGFDASVEQASELEQLRARQSALNLGPEKNAYFEQQVAASQKQLGFISTKEAYEARLGAVAGLGRDDPKVIDETINEALKTAIILKMRGEKGDIQDVVRNLYGLAEARGQTSDPSGMARTFELIQKNNAATGGKLTTTDMETIVRQMKYGLGSTVSDEGLINIMAFANQLKASGGGASGAGVSQAGTAATQVLKWAEGGLKNKQTIAMLSDMGLFKRENILNDSGTTDVNVKAGGLKDSDQAIRDPMGWLASMAPTFLRYTLDRPDTFYKGKDPKDEKAQQEALMRVSTMLTAGQGGVNVGNLMFQAINPETMARINAERQLTLGSKGTEDALKGVDETFKMRTEKLGAAFDTLAATVGTKINPILGALAEALTKIFGVMQQALTSKMSTEDKRQVVMDESMAQAEDAIGLHGLAATRRKHAEEIKAKYKVEDPLAQPAAEENPAEKLRREIQAKAAAVPSTIGGDPNAAATAARTAKLGALPGAGANPWMVEGPYGQLTSLEEYGKKIRMEKDPAYASNVRRGVAGYGSSNVIPISASSPIAPIAKAVATPAPSDSTEDDANPYSAIVKAKADEGLRKALAKMNASVNTDHGAALAAGVNSQTQAYGTNLQAIKDMNRSTAPFDPNAASTKTPIHLHFGDRSAEVSADDDQATTLMDIFDNEALKIGSR